MITAIVHTYNAEKFLDACLSALHGFDELIVVDNESTDNTREIAMKHGAKLLTKPRGEDRIVEAHRQFGIDHATSEWILEVDADEIVTPALHDFLYEHIKEHPEPHGLLIPIKNYFMGQWMKCYYPDYILRFFSREGTIWPNIIHSRPKVTGEILKIDRKRTDLAFIHLANETVSQRVTKMNNYTDREVSRRMAAFRYWQLFTGPTFRFFKTFILKGAWRQGWPGLICSVMDANYRFYTLAKIIEKKKSEVKTELTDNIF